VISCGNTLALLIESYKKDYVKEGSSLESYLPLFAARNKKNIV